MTLFVLSKRFASGSSLVLVTAFCVSFAIGLDLGENVHYRPTVSDYLSDANVQVSDELFRELRLLLTLCHESDMMANQEGEIILSVAIDIIRDPAMHHDDMVKSIAEFREKLATVTNR